MFGGWLKAAAKLGQLLCGSKIGREIAEGLQNNGDAILLLNQRNTKGRSAQLSVLEDGFGGNIFAVQER